jgi:hypothetical protein
MDHSKQGTAFQNSLVNSLKIPIYFMMANRQSSDERQPTVIMLLKIMVFWVVMPCNLEKA